MPRPAYAELQVLTNFTFLQGASHAAELVEQAVNLGTAALAIADINALAGVVRAHVAAKEAGLPLVIGCRLRFDVSLSDHATESGSIASPAPSDILVYPMDRASYGRLCQLLTLGKRRAPKGKCFLTLDDLVEHQTGMLAIVLPPADGLALDGTFAQRLMQLADVFDDDRLSLAATRLYSGDDAVRLAQLNSLSSRLAVPLVATNDVHYHVPERRMLQDVLTCIRLGCTLDQAGLALLANAERHLKPPDEMARLFADCPKAIERTMEIARRAQGFSLDQLRYEYPQEVVPAGLSPIEHLRNLTWAGAAERYREPKLAQSSPPANHDHDQPHPAIPAHVVTQIRHEFALIDELNYAPYFLTVHDIVRFARSRNILCQGRGAAANSAVCYCLGVTAVDPARIDVLFERFISRERNEPPDIDVDFEHERREEVIQYLYAKYGRDRAALTAEVISYRGRSAVREIGKALGLSLDCVDRMAKGMDWWDHGPINENRLRELGVNPRDPTIQQLMNLCKEIRGFPRHLSQHVGGFVLTRGPLSQSVPIENAAMVDRTIIEWDKDDIDALGMLKVDVLGLGMMTCIRKAMDLINLHRVNLPRGPVRCDEHAATSDEPLALHTIPPEDPDVYDAICRADTVGVFQIESRAQMSMLPRLKPRCFYDLVIEVAIVRPGPIHGDMVHPYLRRRDGQEPVIYPNEQVRRVLGKTLGVPLFQEQAMQLAIVAAGFTADEADRLRRAIAAWKTKGRELERLGTKLVGGMVERGYPAEFAERCYRQIQGFSHYGFPESHAASFALLVYASAWLKVHHPTAFAAALLNSQPMGFYAPAQIVRDARDHGVTVRRIDVNHSDWDCTCERLSPDDQVDGQHELSLRLGLRMIRGLPWSEGQALMQAVSQHGPFNSIESLWRASGVRVATLRALAGADALGSMGLDRQHALWTIAQLRDVSLPLFDSAPDAIDATDDQSAATPEDRVGAGASLSDDSFNHVQLPKIAEAIKVVQDYQSTGLSLRAHPLSFARPGLDALGAVPNEQLKDESRWPHGRRIAVAGVVLIRQRPGTASGVVFITLEDETGVANLILRPRFYERWRKVARHARVIMAQGTVERQGQVVHVLVDHLTDIGHHQHSPATKSRDFH